MAAPLPSLSENLIARSKQASEKSNFISLIYSYSSFIVFRIFSPFIVQHH